MKKGFAMIMLLLFLMMSSVNSQTESGVLKLEEISWLSGAWIVEQEGSTIEELWMEPREGLMIGTGRTVFPNKKTFFEYMRISQTDSGIVFYGSPNGENTTPFKLTKSGSGYIQFENPSHDFPQRIIYRLVDDGVLAARVEGMINNKFEFMEWKYRRK